MSFDDIRTGCVVRYPYLWHRESVAGETEGRKFRQVAVAARLVRADGPDGIILLPITATPPMPGQKAVSIPETERRRAGLERDIQLWVVLDEYNYDLVGASWYLEPEPPLGRFSKAFFAPLLQKLRADLPRVRRVSRNDDVR